MWRLWYAMNDSIKGYTRQASVDNLLQVIDPRGRIQRVCPWVSTEEKQTL